MDHYKHVANESSFEKLNNNLYSVPNEMNVNIEIKIEESEEFETDLIVLNPEYKEETNKKSKDLYVDHIIKEELVIGPEEIQESFIEIPLNYEIGKQEDQLDIYQCTKCKKDFKTKQSLYTHSKDVHLLKLCQYCHKIFNKTSNLNRHENYSCPNNESVPKNNEVLKYGMFPNPFICDFCKKTYTHKSSLKNHIRIHMGLPHKYQCKLCSKSYTKSYNLTCHVKSKHLKVKPYSCRYCKKTFSWRYSLTHHINTDHKACGIKTYLRKKIH